MNPNPKNTTMPSSNPNNGLYADMQVFRARMVVSPADIDGFLDAMALLEPPPGSWEDVDSGNAWIEAFGTSERALEKLARDISAIAESLDGKPHATLVEPLAKEDWTDTWKRFVHVLHSTDRMTVRPIWEDYAPSVGEIVIDIEPGMSFGTGIHPTTQSCMRFLQRLAEEGALDRTVVDMGCGSGILAIAARKLGFQSVTGYDYDPSAVRTAAENAKTNGLDIPFQEGNALDSVLPTGDIFVANILAPVLMQAAPAIRKAVSAHPAHALVLSGVLDNQYEAVKVVYTAQGFRERTNLLVGDWRSGLFTRF